MYSIKYGKAALATVICLVAILPAGCKEGNPIGADITPANAEFAAESRPDDVSSHYVSLRTNSISEGRIVFDVLVTNVDDPVTGIAVKLTYPAAFSKFVECTDGDLFPPGQCYHEEPSAESGTVFVSRSVTGLSEATTIEGERVIMRLEFLVFGVSEGRITFEGQNLGGGDTSALLDIDGDPIFVRWYAGVLSGT